MIPFMAYIQRQKADYRSPGKWLLNREGVFLRGDEKVWKLEEAGGCTTKRIH